MTSVQRGCNLISVFCILSWWVFWLTMINRSALKARPSIALTRTEIKLLDRLVNAPPEDNRHLPHQDRQTGRLSRARNRSTAIFRRMRRKRRTGFESKTIRSDVRGTKVTPGCDYRNLVETFFLRGCALIAVVAMEIRSHSHPPETFPFKKPCHSRCRDNGR
jgi:hypothetical protein